LATKSAPLSAECMINRVMHKLFLTLGPLTFTLALLTAGCGTLVVVEGGGNEGPPNPRPPTPNPGPIDCSGAELHVVGIYDPYDSASNTQGPAHVHIDRPGPVKLFLSSYSATDWIVTAGPSTQLVSIVAHAYEPVTVDAPAGVPVATLNTSQAGVFLGCGYEYPDKDPYSGCETPELLAAVQQHMQQPALSFHGCYAASDFVIDANLGSSSNCATDMGYEHTSAILASCTTPTP
jgi:hypothetical protein